MKLTAAHRANQPRVVEVQRICVNRGGMVYLGAREMPPIRHLFSNMTLSMVHLVTKIEAPLYFI